jgi:hypothetical protein
MVMATTPYLPPYLYRPPGYHAWGLFLAAGNVSGTDKPDSATATITITMTPVSLADGQPSERIWKGGETCYS